ncbi:hypothetical protein H6G80_31810 [Nostoc sp. FACHB-87]|uniref:hypothetical protein n=1 Tax=Nostocaceae TaxID=1162 RepID=UPI001684B2B8|nr:MULTISPECIES: hypothetical protein [Nostocaceae]MBD2303354.1 hypothetical protein [Nostoc sp. FACHB-190]MBD2458638.1 hypothetical protein [Nostoc sp. FACHB-87]MBD2479668.1 hypothetical protein [Anabaena sp. FACHB-83]
MNYFKRIAVSLGVLAAMILPLHYWVYLPIREHHNYQQYLKRRQAIEQYVRRMQYHCHKIFTPEKEYGCKKFNEAQESGNFQISPPGKSVKK